MHAQPVRPLLVLLSALLLAAPAAAKSGMASGPAAVQKTAENGPLGRFLSGGIRFFQKVISPVDGPRCTMIPTCSHYALQALAKHGPFIGFMMSADRIVHEYEEQRWARPVRTPQGIRYLDPVENNDFWFRGSGGRK